jgi:hypothetical protein
MNANLDDSDEEYERFKNYDFSNAKRVKDVPHLRALQEKYAKLKVPVALELNQDALGIFRGHAFVARVSVETLMADILEQHAYRLHEELEARLERREAGQAG